LKNNMFVQNLEFIETKNFEYLLIHKTGCQSVFKTLENKKINWTMNQNLQSGKFCWTIFRDPKERFVSGLAHNLSISNIDLNKLNLKQLLFNTIDPELRSISLIPLTILQSTYLIGSKVNMFVKHEDLNDFLKINFNTVFHENKGSSTIKNKINKFINNNINFKTSLEKYLEIDYFIYQQILKSNKFWYWQLGKVITDE